MPAMLRPATPADRPGLIALALAEDAAWSGASEVSAEETGEFIDSLELGAIFERDGRLAGYAAAGESGGTTVLVDPRDPPGPALNALTAWLAERGHREVIAYAADVERIAWLEANGFTHRHSAFDLQRGIDPPLPPAAWPDGVDLARYRPGEDDEAVHALVYVDAAWADVPGHSERSLDAWRSMIGPEYRGWIARRDGRPVGWVAGRVFSDGRGWIQQLSVARPDRGAGLGRALLLHSLDDLRSAGATSFALSVQAANEHALGLYRGIGFEVEREFRLYAGDDASGCPITQTAGTGRRSLTST
jgi:ribosomal protein S18 acetylase RimI-like enzyme